MINEYAADPTRGLQARLQAWNPAGKRACGNCLHAKVRGHPADPQVRCARGHGRAVPLEWLVRAQPRGCANASRCPDFSSMDD